MMLFLSPFHRRFSLSLLPHQHKKLVKDCRRKLLLLLRKTRRTESSSASSLAPNRRYYKKQQRLQYLTQTALDKKIVCRTFTTNCELLRRGNFDHDETLCAKATTT
jgi:hypothetical protein